MIEKEAPRTAEQKAAAAASAADRIEKAHGKGSIVKLGSRVGQPVPHIPSGIYAVDEEVLGIGGFPKGRIIEIYGPESGGKTTMALTVVASAQAAGGLAAFVDAEHALDPTWASKNGVNVDELFVSQPDNGEQALEITEELVNSEAFDIIVVDSVAALVPRSELEGDMGDSNMGVQARLMSQAMRKLVGAVARTSTIVIFINQIREKIGVMFGSPETTTGGRALKFFSSVRLDVRRIASVKEGDTFVGNKVRIKAVKNKVSAPFREAEVDLYFDSGFDKLGSLFDKAVEAGVITKSGSWFSLDEDRLGQGRSKSVAAITSSPELLTKVKKGLQK